MVPSFSAAGHNSGPWDQDLSGLNVHSSKRASVCTRLYEVVAECLAHRRHEEAMVVSGWLSLDHGQEEWRTVRRDRLVCLAWYASNPMVYQSEASLPSAPFNFPLGSSPERSWPRADFFVQACRADDLVQSGPHSILRTIATDLVSNRKRRPLHDTIFGALVSHDTVVILRIDNARNQPFEAWRVSSASLSISKSGLTRSNPAIGSLVRFGQSRSPSLAWMNLTRLQGQMNGHDIRAPRSPPRVARGSLLHLPPELLLLVIHWTDDEDLMNLASVCRQTMLAVQDTTRICYPKIGEHRLIDVRPIRLAPEVTPEGEVILPKEDTGMYFAAFVTESDEVLLLGIQSELGEDYLRRHLIRSSGSGEISVQYWPFAAMHMSYVVVQKGIVEELEQDATREGFVGRIMRRRERLLSSWTQQYADWDDLL